MFLNSHTYYSLRYGVMSPHDLLALAAGFGLRKLVVTDINSSSACMEVCRLSKKYGVDVVLGVDFRNGVDQAFIGIAKNNKGYEELNTFLSAVLRGDAVIDDRAPDFPNAYVVYPLNKYNGFELKPNEYVGVAPDELVKYSLSGIGSTLKGKVVALQTVTFRNKRDFNAHRLLRSIDNNTLLSKLPISEQGSVTDQMCNLYEGRERYQNFPEIIEATVQLIETCGIYFEFEDVSGENQRSFLSSEKEDGKLLRRLVDEGLHYRYPSPSQKVLDRIEMEIDTITEKGFVSYFLINWEMLRYARSKGYFYVGRGSGANSVVAYILRITDVDPIDLDLYFERFINLYRQNPPDFDIDFSWQDRDDVTKFIFDRFPNVALLATYNTFQYRALVRELGKVFGLPKHEIDVLSKGDFKFSELDELKQLVLRYGQLIDGFPNYLSVHAGGILISEKPLEAFGACFMPPKGFPTTQFDMHIAEDVGLCKFDILSQRGLGKIKDAVAIVNENCPDDPKIDIHDIQRFREDEEIKYLLSNAKAIGCFYVESPAMRMLLRKLKVDDYLGLVAASSVIRPGVAQSGMMREYIFRFRDPSIRKDANPIMLDLMPETYGVMVYQEDVIKVAHYFGKLTLGEADMLRRGMSGKFRSREEFQKVKQRFFDNCKGEGYPDTLTSEVWRQIESFAGYAFAKGHSASYAVESYQSLFLKAHYPREYMVATINNGGGYYRTWVYVHEARKHGAVIHAPSINESSSACVIKGRDLYLGFSMLQGLESRVVKGILCERAESGPFLSFLDFIERVVISADQASILVRIDAFRDFGKPKRELLWLAHLNLSKKVSTVETPDLFRVSKRSYSIPDLANSWQEDAFDQQELLGFSLCDPFDLLVDQPKEELLARELPDLVGKKVTIVGNLVTVKKTTTSSKKTMFFGTFLDREGEWLDSVHFPPIAAKFPFRGRGIYAVTGIVAEEFGVCSVEAESMEKLLTMDDPRYSD